LSRLGFGAALVRFLPKAEKPTEMINSCISLSSLVSLAVAIIFVAGIDIWSPKLAFIRDEVVFVLAFVVFAILTNISGITEQVFIAKRRTQFVLIRDVIFCLLKIVLPFLMAIVFHSFGIVSSWGIALGVAVIVSIVIFFPRVQEGYRPLPKLDLGIINRIWRYSSGNYFATLFGAAPRQVLPLLIVNLHHLGAEQTAYFYVAWRIASLLFMIPTQASKSLFAEGSHFEDKLAANVRRSYKFAFLLLVPAVVVVLLAGKWLLLLFGASYSENALSLLRVITFSSLFVAVNHVYYSVLKVQGRVRELIVLRGFIALATLIGTYIITPTTGIVGVGYAWIASQAVVSVYIMLFMRTRFVIRSA
jgi:O-antigen/teichoic acid export membrane protein